MKFLVFCFLAASLPTVQPGSPELLEKLLALATQYSAPFTQSALDRINGTDFGANRAPRISDVAIYNILDQSFELLESSCSMGSFSSRLRPVNKIPAHSSVVFGTENNGLWTGIECSVTYKATDGTSFQVTTRNPYFDSASEVKSSSPSIKVTEISWVKFIVVPQ